MRDVSGTTVPTVVVLVSVKATQRPRGVRAVLSGPWTIGPTPKTVVNSLKVGPVSVADLTTGPPLSGGPVIVDLCTRPKEGHNPHSDPHGLPRKEDKASSILHGREGPF